MVSSDKYPALQITHRLEVLCHFSLAAFKTFFFIFSFKKLNYNAPWISLGLSYLGFSQLLESVGLCSLPNLESFQLLFLQVFFSPAFFLLSFQDSSDVSVESFVIVPKDP